MDSRLDAATEAPSRSARPRRFTQYSLTQLLIVMALLALVLEWHRFFANFPLRVTSDPAAFAQLWREIFAYRDFEVAATGSFLLLIGLCLWAPTRWVRLLALAILLFAGLLTLALAGVAISIH